MRDHSLHVRGGFVTRCVVGCLALAAFALALPASAVHAAPLTVMNCHDSGTGSLRDAITTANGTTGDIIHFQAGLSCPTTAPITLTSGMLTLTAAMTIDGTGATIAVDGNNAAAVFQVTSGVTATITALTIQHGNIATVSGNGGGIRNLGTLTATGITYAGNVGESGGAILNTGTLTVTNSLFAGNTANFSGGGIENLGTLTVTGSTFTGNSSGGAGSGGIYNTSGVSRSMLTVTGSTFASNDGGIFNNTGTVNVANSTFANNTSSFGADGIYNGDTLTVTSSTFSGNNGGITNAAINVGCTATLTNVLVANSTGNDLTNGCPFTGTNNLIDDATSAGGFTDHTSGNIVGHPALLGTLGSYGGMTQTVPLLTGSPAINAGAAIGSGPAGNPVPATDQRGLARVGVPDIGAFEVQGPPPNPLPGPQPPGPVGGLPNPLPAVRPAGSPGGVPNPLPARRP